MAGSVLIFTADTGGGHNAVSSALAKGFRALENGPTQVVVCDLLRDLAPWPYNRLGPNHNWIATRPPWLMGGVFWLDRNPWLTRVLYAVSFPILRPILTACLEKHRPDVVIAVHPHYTQLMARLGGTPFVTMASDLAQAPITGFSSKAILTLVASESIRSQALGRGLSENSVQVAGLPVDLDHGPVSKGDLGLLPDLPVVVVVGGGEGYGGPMEAIAQALGNSAVALQLVVITGRNHVLRERLGQLRTANALWVKGYVESLVPWLSVADILVTKAGPSTLAESFACGVPSLIFGHLPGPEAANVRYVNEQGAGRFCPDPQRLVAATQRWLSTHPEERQRAGQQARALARPRAAVDCARAIWSRIQSA